jgi:hypothetical protein
MLDPFGRRAVSWLALTMILSRSPAIGAEKPRSGARNPAEVATRIDRAIDRRLEAAKIPASPRSDDGEFLRRATLHLLGRIPRGERAEAFLDG